MIGGEDEPVTRLDPIFRSIAPGEGEAPPTPGRDAGRHRAARLPPLRAVRCGSLREDGPQRHRVRDHGRVRRGANVLHRADIGSEEVQASAEIAPLDHPEYYRYDIDVPEVAEVWRRGSVVASWLLDLTAAAMVTDPTLADLSGRVSDWARAAGRSTRPSTRASRCRCCRRRSSRGSRRAASRNSPTGSCRRCGCSSGGTWSSSRREMARTACHRVLSLGGGFGGASAARALRRVPVAQHRQPAPPGQPDCLTPQTGAMTTD